MENERNQKVMEHDLRVPSYEENKEKEFPQKSTRELALEWWRSLSLQKQLSFYKERDIQSLTGREIEEIWRKELFSVEKDILNSINGQENEFKPNQKQFNHFSPELFKKYIDKFSDEDKNKAFQLIFDSINDDKKHSFLVKSEIIDWYKSNCY